MEIVFKDVEHRYQIHTPFERTALYDINLAIPENAYYAVIGHTGSGKSTLVQHLNALLKPTKGKVEAGEFVISSNKKAKDLKALRKKVGMVFQYPEHQLFEETVEKDICFAPINYGVSEEDAKIIAKESLNAVGLPEELLTRSPFDLSGGQMRRVAIAGVLAMEPDVLVLDEPTAGLDPKGRKEMMALFQQLHEQKGLTIILVTHNMNDAAKYAEHIFVMDQATLYMEGTPREVFSEAEQLREIGLDVPESVVFLQQLEKVFNTRLDYNLFTPKEISQQIKSLMLGGDQR
ncbi:energy-coupling factor ABC transporter ATP-binding protein [Bacillus solimangrovi]|uniref:Energy-coupling factor transporter ATP-binding protein EcfA2 n=1 Tax=Bacillus solimangrovi TaxID=1305675 RepID=A0A1E5LGL6_9BACI|nr:energy-coupling factor ABC transporter ATP-binding protein [Bacillus solimangrovi]OEH93219.1 energy-coupling factor ABC transporter ATP-binding protein [Bacillus solimangrovi]